MKCSSVHTKLSLEDLSNTMGGKRKGFSLNIVQANNFLFLSNTRFSKSQKFNLALSPQDVINVQLFYFSIS